MQSATDDVRQNYLFRSNYKSITYITHVVAVLRLHYDNVNVLCKVNQPVHKKHLIQLTSCRHGGGSGSRCGGAWCGRSGNCKINWLRGSSVLNIHAHSIKIIKMISRDAISLLVGVSVAVTPLSYFLEVHVAYN